MPPPYSSNGGANGVGNAGSASATGSNQMRPPFAMLPFPQQGASSSQNGTNQYDASYSVVPQFKQEPQNRANGTANGM